MKKRLLSVLMVLCMVLTLLPVSAFAGNGSYGNYEVTVQAVIRDSDGHWVSTNALTSKNFNGTTVAGSSGGGSEGKWQWTPSGGGYILTATLNSHANAWGGLKYPTALWEYDTDELEFVGIGKNSYATEVAYPDDVNSSFLFERNSYLLANSEGGGWYRTYIFEQKAPEPEPDPVITVFTKERVTTEPDEDTITLPEGVTVNYGDPVEIPNGGEVTLLYKLTVTGDEGANFTITDEDATLVGSDCDAEQASAGAVITGTIPEGATTATIYVIRTFNGDDIVDDKLTNTATIAPGESTDLDDGVGPATDDGTEASEATPTIDGFTKERVTTPPVDGKIDGVIMNPFDETVDYGATVTIPADGSVTLMYKLTVTGDAGTFFKIADENVKLVGNNCNASRNNSTGIITGSIPEGESAVMYVIKTFTASDIDSDGELVNTATIEAGTDSDLDDTLDGDGDGKYETSDDGTNVSTEPSKDPVTVSKTLSSVVRDGQEVKPVGSETVLYEDDKVTWTIKITNNTNDEMTYRVTDLLTYSNVQAGTATMTWNGTVINNDSNTGTVTIPANSAVDITATYTVDPSTVAGEGTDLTNTVQVRAAGSGASDEILASASATNPVGYTIKVTYNGNGGTADGEKAKTVVVRSENDPVSTPIEYTVESGAFGFTYTGHSFDGWYTAATGGDEVSGEERTLDRSATYFAHWTENPPAVTYTVTFDTNGGTTQSWTQPVVQGQAISEPADPTWDDSHIFLGWTETNISGLTYGAGADLPDMVFQNGASFTPADNTTLYAVWGEDSNHDGEADVYEVFIAPADITIYTGGDGYSGVTDENGVAINNPNSGLPEPGFHIILPADLNMGFGHDLHEKVRFTYEGPDNLSGGTQVTREWTLSYVGVYSEEPLQYVYSLVSADGTPAIRMTYTDANGTALEDDDIGMTEDAAHGTYTMSINRGGLSQNLIQAVITKMDGTQETRSLVIGTGELTIRSTVDDDTNAIVGNESDVSGGFTAVDTGASYMVNDSQVQVPTEGGRIHLLVDQVSDSADFNTAMGEAALGHANMPDASYDTAYLDLVDTQNGNAVVTLENGSVDIYWPMPADADPGDTFQVVHYYNMNRENTVDADSLHEQAAEVLYGTAVSINGDWYVRFTTDSFSPFVLVWESAEEPTPDPTPDPGEDDDDHDRPHGGSGDSDPTGNLSIELDVNGGDDAFTFTVILTDKNGKDLKNNFYYNGDYTGTIGSGDEITLEGGEKIVIRNLPEGTRYEVIIETADGYTYIIDGEEGVIHIGMNEAEFTANRTVSLADPSVTGVSRWLNTTDHIAYLTGYPSGAFGPDNSMTRAEVAQMFYALLNNKNVTITKTFPDVPSDAWYATAVNTLASLGMVSGDADGSFRPNDPITRAEFCVIALAFAYEPENAVCYFGDVARSDWFYTYVAQAASYGWIGGYANGNFGPNDQITRAQVTTIVNNMLGRAADRNYVIDHQAGLVQFSDLTRAHWGYFQIMEAANAHDYTKSNGSENWR